MPASLSLILLIMDWSRPGVESMLGSQIISGTGGGGRKDFAQAGGQDQTKIDEAFEKLKSLI